MSRRKDRQTERLAPEVAAMAAVRELLSQPNVCAIEGELASPKP